MDGNSPDEAHSVSAVAVIDLSDAGGGGADDPHGLLTSSVVVIGGDDGGHDTMGSASDGLMQDDDEEEEEDGEEEENGEDEDGGGEGSECGSQCGHAHSFPTHMIHIGCGPSQGFIVTGKPGHQLLHAPPPSSPTASSTTSRGKRKRVVLSIHDKQKVIQRLDLGEQPIVIARDYGISRQQVSDIKKNKERILAFCIDAKHVSSLKRKTLKATTEFHPGVEQELYRWLIRQRRLGRGVTSEALTNKATDLFMQYAADDSANVSFRSISVWLRHFKKAHGIRNMSEDELARLPHTFTPAMEMNGGVKGDGNGSSTSSTTATEPTLTKEAPANSIASVDDVSSFMNTGVDHAHHSFLLQNHAPHAADYNGGAQSFQMFMLSTETPGTTPATLAATALPPSLQSCAHIAQTLTLQLSLFEREMHAKLNTLDSRVQKLGFTVLSSSSSTTRFA